jgi:hypothetical protein
MFMRSLKALGSRRPRGSVIGGRSILVLPKSERPGTAGRALGGPGHTSAAERRRRNLLFLAGFIVVTFLLGLVPALRFLLVVNVVADVLLVLYLGAALYIAGTSKTLEREPFPPLERRSEAAGGSWH